MKNWIEKMKKGMEMISEACQENREWTKCRFCPFDKYCTALMEAKLIDGFDGPFYPPKEEEEEDK